MIMRSPRQLNTSRAWNHVTNQLWIQQIIQKRPIQSGKVLQQRREREPMPDPSVTAIQSHHVRIKAATQIHHKSHSNKKTRKLPAKRQPERICADDLLQIQKRIPHVSRPTTTQEYFKSQSWLNRVEELTFTFAAYDKQENHFDHILVTHDRLEWPLQLPTLLMRDSCSCSQCKHPVTKQRLVDTFSLPERIWPKIMKVKDNTLYIKWMDDHESYYGLEWLSARHKPLDASAIWTTRFRQWYDFSQPTEPPSVPYENVMNSDDGLRLYLNLIAEYGFCFVDGCPIDPDATRQLLERIAFIRLTHYGGFYDFTSDLSLKDTAYTNLALAPHTDNTYFSDPTGLQMLHLLSHEDGEGGLSTLVDGFQVADVMATSHPNAFNLLNYVNIPAHASGNSKIGSITPTYSQCRVVHTLRSGETCNGKIPYTKIRWNNSDRAAFAVGHDGSRINAWYKAAKIFNSLVNSKEHLWEFQLQPGRPLIFDNWRMLHGRTAFTGKRRMAGGYINMDDFVAKYKQLNLGNKRILESV